MEHTAYRPQGSLQGKKALVVGATGGLGRAVAKALHAADAEVLLHGRSEERLASSVAELGVRTSALQADLAEGAAPPALLEAARLCDLLVLAYGPFAYRPLAETSPEDWRAMALGCLALPGALATEAAKAMAARGFGRILFFGGTRTDAIRGFRMNAAYAAAKTGLGVVAKSIAVEFGGRGVSCALLCPGFVDTEYLDEETRRRLAAASPRDGLIPEDEIAGLALRLLAGDMDLANGAIVTADRGLYAL